MKTSYIVNLIGAFFVSFFGLMIYNDGLKSLNDNRYSSNGIWLGFTFMIIGLVISVLMVIKLIEEDKVEELKVDLPRTYMFYTIKRNNKTITIVDAHSNMLVFLEVEKELGNKTFILYAKELTKEEYDFYIENNSYGLTIDA